MTQTTNKSNDKPTDKSPQVDKADRKNGESTNKKKTASTPLSNEEFVRVWQDSRNLAEAACRAGAGKRAVSLRASNMRGLGVELKRFKEVSPRIDVAKLSAIAKGDTDPNESKGGKGGKAPKNGGRS